MPRYESLQQLREALPAMRAAPAPSIVGAWTAAQVLEHCAQSLDCQVKGFAALKPWIVRATVGRLVLALFFARGRMSHDRVAPVPGLGVPVDRPWTEAVDRLAASLDAFLAHEGAYATHPVFGDMSRDACARYHALHVNDHLGDV